MAGLNVDWAGLAWGFGRYIPRRLTDAFSKVAAPLASLKSLPAVDAWAETVSRATGSVPTPAMRRLLIQHWIRNNLWSLSLERWNETEIRRVVDIPDEHVARLRSSLSGKGLVLALPHMGSWDFAGAWCAHVGIQVVSVAERLPRGLYERFSAARQRMGMTIYPVDQPRLLHTLADEVRSGKLVCLLADRDLSKHGLTVPWPGTSESISVPAGPALLAMRTGADLRVATSYFDGPTLGMTVSPRIVGGDPTALMSGAVEHFAEAVRRHPESWMMLRQAFS